MWADKYRIRSGIAFGLMMGVAGLLWWALQRSDEPSEADGELVATQGKRQEDGIPEFAGVHQSRENRADVSEEVVALEQGVRDVVLEFQSRLERGDRGGMGELGVARRIARPDRVWAAPVQELEFEAFRAWAEKYAEAATGLNQADIGSLAQEGERLAKARLERMEQLIPEDPARALELTVPLAVRAALPNGVLDWLEQRVEGVGDYEVRVRLPAEESARQGSLVTRRVVMGDKIYDAHVSGWRQDEPSQLGVPLYGIAVKNVLALSEISGRVLEADEERAWMDSMEDGAEAGLTCAIGGEPAKGDVEEMFLVRASGFEKGKNEGLNPLFVCGCAHAETLMIEWRMENIDSTSLDLEGMPRQKRAYTEGSKRLIFIRVDFSDMPGAPFSNAAGTNIVTNLDTFFREQSYGRMRVAPLGAAGSAMTPILRMPQSASWYGQRDATLLRNDARTAATGRGYAMGSYQFDLICMGSVPGFNWAGLGFVGQPGSWIRSSFGSDVGVIAHELGHNLGLNHANFWNTREESVVGAGNSEEYGDIFDTMGGSGGVARHFNSRYKNYLDWIPNAGVLGHTTNGIYRLYAQDRLENPALPRAIRITRGNQTNYWLEVRQRWPNNDWMENGIGVRWASTGNQSSQLLDTTPGSPNGRTDSPLVLGRTLVDPLARLYITPLRRAGTAPRFMDVAIYRGVFSGNHAPEVGVNVSSVAVAVNAPVSLTAQASDADGDELAYDWDFGDGTRGENQPQVIKRWTSLGEYVVRSTVSDLRGGIGSDIVVVRVGNPATFRAEGKVTFEGEPMPDVRITSVRPFVPGGLRAMSASNGRFIVTGLGRTSYHLRAQSDQFLYLRRGFDNPVFLSSNMTSLDFVAVRPTDLPLETLLPLNAEWRYFDEGRLPASNWLAPAYNDAAWPSGVAPLGYGVAGISTIVSYGPNASNKRITTYFRRKIVVDDPSQIVGLTLGVMRDDGILLYINGREVHRDNLPTGAISTTTQAVSAVSSADESRIFEVPIDPTWLVPGTNQLAASVHQVSPQSSDIKFALRLVARMAPTNIPDLSTDWTGEGWRLTWPSSPSGFFLESAVSTSGPWLPVDLDPDLVGAGDSLPRLEAGTWVWEPSASLGNRYFRLGRR